MRSCKAPVHATFVCSLCCLHVHNDCGILSYMVEMRRKIHIFMYFFQKTNTKVLGLINWSGLHYFISTIPLYSCWRDFLQKWILVYFKHLKYKIWNLHTLQSTETEKLQYQSNTMQILKIRVNTVICFWDFAKK